MGDSMRDVARAVPNVSGPSRRGSARYCSHRKAHEFYNFRSYAEALRERNDMAERDTDVHVSKVYLGQVQGWAWTVCPDCPKQQRRRLSG